MSSRNKYFLTVLILVVSFLAAHSTSAQIAPTTTNNALTSTTSGTPAAPTITSSTHPDQDKWYSKTEVDFTWNLEASVTESQILIGKLPKGQPKVNYAAPTNTKHLTLSEDTWYFHVRVKNSYGWSETTHFKIQIDTTAPTDLKVTAHPQVSGSAPSFDMSATDALSGIDHFAINIDQGQTIDWKPSNSEPFTVPSLMPGDHTLNIKAVDKAGNNIETKQVFTTTELTPPQLNAIKSSITSGEKIAVTGSTYPNTRVTIWIKNSSGELSSKVLESNEQGTFSLEYENQLTPGTYTIWAELITPKGLNKSSDQQIIEITPGTQVTPPVQLPVEKKKNKTIFPLLLALFLLAIAFAIKKLFPILLGFRVKNLAPLKTKIVSEKKHVEQAFEELKSEIVSCIEDKNIVNNHTNRSRHHKRFKKRKNFIKKIKTAEQKLNKKIERLEK